MDSKCNLDSPQTPLSNAELVVGEFLRHILQKSGKGEAAF